MKNRIKISLYQSLLISRIYVLFSILISVLMMFEPLSALGRASLIVGDFKIFAVFGIILCLFALIDIIVNDIMPDDIKFLLIYNHRHIFYMLLAILSVSLSVVVISTYGTSFLLCRLWLDGAIATVVAFLDIKERNRKYFGIPIRIRST